MDMPFNRFFDTMDLVPYHNALCFLGVFLAVYNAQLFGRDVFNMEYCRVARDLRRFSMLLLALGFLWALSYSSYHKWQPWPPDILIIVAVNAYLVSTIIAAASKQRILG